jgi:hypothetical protein
VVNIFFILQIRIADCENFNENRNRFRDFSEFQLDRKLYINICAKNLILFVWKLRDYKRKGILREETRVMRNQENELRMSDLALLLFIGVAGWLLLFQSGLFQ